MKSTEKKAPVKKAPQVGAIDEADADALVAICDLALQGDARRAAAQSIHSTLLEAIVHYAAGDVAGAREAILRARGGVMSDIIYVIQYSSDGCWADWPEGRCETLAEAEAGIDELVEGCIDEPVDDCRARRDRSDTLRIVERTGLGSTRVEVVVRPPVASSTTELLIAGRARIARGWTQGWQARTASGAEVADTDPAAVCWCASGALTAGAGDFSGALSAPMRGAMRELRAALPAGGMTSEWNDEPHRTQADVLALYDRAIERSRP